MIQRVDHPHKRRIRGMTCIIRGCRMGAEQHHVRRPCLGIGKRDDAFSMPLCPCTHHRSGRYGDDPHAGRKTFEKRHGTEAYLLRLTYAKLDLEMPERVREWVERHDDTRQR